MWAKYGANIGQNMVQNMGKIWTKDKFLTERIMYGYERESEKDNIM